MMGNSPLRGAMVAALLFLANAAHDAFENIGAAIKASAGYSGPISINGRRHTGVAQAKREAKKARNRAAQRRYR